VKIYGVQEVHQHSSSAFCFVDI